MYPKHVKNTSIGKIIIFFLDYVGIKCDVCILIGHKDLHVQILHLLTAEHFPKQPAHLDGHGHLWAVAPIQTRLHVILSLFENYQITSYCL